jgi:hypothetical protein
MGRKTVYWVCWGDGPADCLLCVLWWWADRLYIVCVVVTGRQTLYCVCFGDGPTDGVLFVLWWCADRLCIVCVVLMADSCQLSNITVLCVTELPYTSLLMWAQERCLVWATVYRLITEIGQKWGDRNQTFCTEPPGGSMEFTTNCIWCTAAIEKCVIWIIWANYSVCGKEPTDSWCLEGTDWELNREHSRTIRRTYFVFSHI